jgi:two-component system NtrC family sensor kinase
MASRVVHEGEQMTGAPWLRSITSTLSFRLFVILASSILVLFAAHMAVSRQFQSTTLEQQVTREAYRSSDFLLQSLSNSMLRDERQHTYALMRLVGAEPGVEGIRIYNKQGTIRFSSDPAEIGTTVDLRAEACYGCHGAGEPLEAVPTHERSRIYRTAEGYRVLGMINAIRNDESCWTAQCHAHTADQSILGVLDVQMSMAALDQSLSESGRDAVVLALVIVLLSMAIVALIIYRAVYVPTATLRRGTEALGQGNLGVTIELDRADELGDLAHSFNQMARRLRDAYAELQSWSLTLEDRVRQKTKELERMTQQMIQVERTSSLGRMAATVAHELNNPLSGILTYSKLIAKRVHRVVPDGPDRAQVLENLDLIRSESQRCGRIVRDLLTYARGRSAELREAQLHPIVDQALKLVAHHVELQEIETDAQLALADDTIVCDREQLVQSLLALFVNAIEAMPDGGTLGVRTAAADEDGWVTVSVSDTGIGIPEDVQDSIFDPFFSTKNEAKGVGLGLAVVYGIVQRHEGEIKVDSRPGHGARFTIRLPRDPTDAARTRTHRQRERQADA